MARCLKEQLGMEIVEMDQEIERQQSLSIPEIFEQYGEGRISQLETKLLIEMQKKNGVILSCGGGVVMREEECARKMKKNGYVVLLTAAPQTIYERVKENDDRPLLKGRKNVEYIAQRWKHDVKNMRLLQTWYCRRMKECSTDL